MLRKIRIIAASIFFCLITLLFLDFTGTVHAWFGWMARVQFLPAVLSLNVGMIAGLLLLTLLFGRCYCAVICPLGVLQDVFSCLGGKALKNRFRYRKPRTVLRYALLALFVLLLLLGLHSVALLVAPYSAYGRIASQLFAPLYAWGNNLLASLAEHYGSYAFYTVDVWMKGLPVLLVAAVTFAVVGACAFFGGRIWCNTLCPVGSVLGFVARFALLKPRIDNAKCVRCGKCERQCRASCIRIAAEPQLDYSRCVGCMDCVSQCPTGAFSYAPSRKKEKKNKETDRSKRDFLGVSALLAAGAFLQSWKVDGGLAVLEAKKPPRRSLPVRPAGSVSLQSFERHCTACQLCVSVCPDHVLRPASDLEHWLRPEMFFERGYCRLECTRCADVCPTGAIQRVTPAEKSSLQNGHAVWIAENCLRTRDGVSCEACYRHCPAGAIQWVTPVSGGMPVPAVHTAHCIACGACEYFCPARPFSAIYIEGHETQKFI